MSAPRSRRDFLATSAGAVGALAPETAKPARAIVDTAMASFVHRFPAASVTALEITLA